MIQIPACHNLPQSACDSNIEIVSQQVWMNTKKLAEL